jgi:aldose 1-epimerase
LRASFAPSAGMVCCSLRHHGEELLAQRSGVRAYAERGSTMGIPLLYPWANRLAGFTYGAAPQMVELARDCSLLKLDERGLPIHGVIAGRLPWKLLDARPGDGGGRLRARMSWEQPELLEIFPFPHTLELDAAVHGGSLTIETTLRASSQVAVPVSFGYHPYLSLPRAERSSWQIELPVTTALQLDARMIPTGVREPVHYPRFALGQGSWDNAFGELARPPLFAVSAAGRRIELEFLDGYRYAQVYAPRGERFVCFEPMTAPTNALVSREDLPSVEPGSAFRAAFRISVR